MSFSNGSMEITRFKSKGILKYLLILVFLFFIELSISVIIAKFSSQPRYNYPEIVTAKRKVTPDNYLPINTLISVGVSVISSNIENNTDLSVDHIEIYEKKGVVLLSFKDTPWVVQLEGATGRVLAVSEQKLTTPLTIYSVSWLDQLLGTKGVFSTIYISLMSLVMLGFSIFGIKTLIFSNSKNKENS